MKTLLKSLSLLVLGAALLAVAADLPYGEPVKPAMDEYFLRHAQRDTGANNVVTAIVFDYRGFDTLGEATVLFTAVLGVGLVLRKTKAGEEMDDE